SPVAGSSAICPERKRRLPARIPCTYGPIAAGARDVRISSFMAPSPEDALDLVDALDLSQPRHDAVHVRAVLDVEREADKTAAPLQALRIHVADVGPLVGDGRDDPREDTLLIPGVDGQGDLVERVAVGLPLHVDPSFRR